MIVGRESPKPAPDHIRVLFHVCRKSPRFQFNLHGGSLLSGPCSRIEHSGRRLHGAQLLKPAPPAAATPFLPARRSRRGGEHSRGKCRVLFVRLVAEVLVHKCESPLCFVVEVEETSEPPEGHQRYHNTNVLQHALARQILRGGRRVGQGRRRFLKILRFRGREARQVRAVAVRHAGLGVCAPEGAALAAPRRRGRVPVLARRHGVVHGAGEVQDPSDAVAVHVVPVLDAAAPHVLRVVELRFEPVDEVGLVRRRQAAELRPRDVLGRVRGFFTGDVDAPAVHAVRLRNVLGAP